MSKPFDLSKFRKSLTKSIDGLSIGFNDPKDWISTGNFALNYLISGNFNKGIPLGKVTMFAGESGCLPESATVKMLDEKHILRVTTVKDLKTEFYKNRNIRIDTPDGLIELTEWFDKGVLPMVRIRTASGLETKCACDHLLQLSKGSDVPKYGYWIPASRVVVGDELLTVKDKNDKVVAVCEEPPEECYDFTINHQNHRYWGDGFSSHNSGKSFICAGSIVKHAQQQGIFVVLIDSENALDEDWLAALGVDTSEEKLLKLSMAMIDDVAKTLSEFMKDYRNLPEEERPKVLFVIDSLGMLLTPVDVDQFNKGDLKGDMGRKPKALAALIRNCVNMFGSFNVGMVCTNHTYASQDIFDPEDKISGGNMVIYASSIVVAMRKTKLKENSDGDKISSISGITSACKVTKTRYNKPFESVKIKIPYETGMSETSGLVDLFEGKSLLVQEGTKLSYTQLNGEVIKKFRKQWERNDDDCLMIVMNEFFDKTKLRQTDTEIELRD